MTHSTARTSVSTLLARLEGVRPAGDGRWYARCPAHDDRSPSLSIRDTGDRILIHDHAGCAAEEVLAAIGLAWRDLYADPWRASYAVATAAPQGRRYAERMLRDTDPLEVERMVLRIAAADLRAGRALSAGDRARVEVARLRLGAAEQEAA